jgi:hypothetical protein
MRVGTKSILFGVHQFILHPIFVAIAWHKLYGKYPEYCYRSWSLDLPKYWFSLLFCFIVHDLGYWGSPEMDGPNGGDMHPRLGAELAHAVLDKVLYYEPNGPHAIIGDDRAIKDTTWYYFCMCHSRFLSKQLCRQPSKLCMADKLAMCYYPNWLYLLLARLSGELTEYMKSAEPDGKHGHMQLTVVTPIEWLLATKKYMFSYANEFKNGKIDNVTELQGVKSVTINGKKLDGELKVYIGDK